MTTKTMVTPEGKTVIRKVTFRGKTLETLSRNYKGTVRDYNVDILGERGNTLFGFSCHYSRSLETNRKRYSASILTKTIALNIYKIKEA